MLSRSEVVSLLEPLSLKSPLLSAFQSHSHHQSTPAKRIPSPLGDQNSAMILVPGLVEGIPAYTVKVHAKFPDQNPAIRGVLLLHDLVTGSLLAIMDSTYITAVRTGLSAALATDLLARPDAQSVAIIGAGVQGEYQLRFLSRMRAIQKVVVFDLHADRAIEFAKRLSEELDIDITVDKTVESSVNKAEIILTATWTKEPFLFLDHIQEGTHITTLGPDQPGKCEVDAKIIQQSCFICDDRDLAVQMGAIGGAGLGVDSIDAELGEVIGHHHPGRISSSQITVYGSVGLAFQDLVVGWEVYQKAQKNNAQNTMDFLA